MVAELTHQEEKLLYSNNLGRKSFQWELWQSCNNRCDFCYIGTDERCINKERQLKSLSDLKKALDQLNFNEYNNVSLIGGEFFQGQLNDADVKAAFMEIIQMLADLYVQHKLGSIWVSATLTVGKQEDLYEALNIFDKAGVRPVSNYGASGVWVCTSWDSQGRFHSEKARHNWEFHMKNISKRYPWVKKNTTIILMQKFCEEYIEGKFNPKAFSEEFGTLLFYKAPVFFQKYFDGCEGFPSILEWQEQGRVDEYLTTAKTLMQNQIGFQFFPGRKTFRQFLVKYAKEDTDTFDKLFNIEYRADELHRNFNDDEESLNVERSKQSNLESSVAIESVVNPNCLIADDNLKHITTYASYADSNACMVCDRDQVWESVRG